MATIFQDNLYASSFQSIAKEYNAMS